MTLYLDGLRAAGRARFSQLGFPTRRQEAWRFTDLGPLARRVLQPATGASVPLDGTLVPTLLGEGELASPRLVFVDGHWRPELSRLDALPPGVVLTGLGQAIDTHPDLVAARLGRHAPSDDQALAALNAGALDQGALLWLGAGVHLMRPIELVFVDSGVGIGLSGGGGGDALVSAQPRLLITLETGSVATVVEHHLSLGDTEASSFHNGVTEFSLAAGAQLYHYKAQRQNRAAFHLATVAGALERDARYEGFLLTMGGRLTRNEVRLTLNGPGTDVRLNGAYMVRGDQHCDTTTLIDHAHGHGSSRQLVKGVIDDRASGVFQGKVLVRPGAQKTNAHQLNRALLLSDHARIDTKPELEIYADDVKCGHGATAGDLDDDALFYLRARGIDREGARALLIGAFVNEAIAEISCDPVRTAFEALAADWLVNEVP